MYILQDISILIDLIEAGHVMQVLYLDMYSNHI